MWWLIFGNDSQSSVRQTTARQRARETGLNWGWHYSKQRLTKAFKAKQRCHLSPETWVCHTRLATHCVASLWNQALRPMRREIFKYKATRAQMSIAQLVQSDQYSFSSLFLISLQVSHIFLPGVCESFPQPHFLISGCYCISNKQTIRLLYQDSNKQLKSRNIVLLPHYLLVKDMNGKNWHCLIALTTLKN